MVSPKNKHNISRIIPFGYIWFAFSVVYVLMERGLLSDLTTYPATGTPYDFKLNFFLFVILNTLIGLVIGVIEILYFNNRFSNSSLTHKLVYKTIIYISTLMSFLLLASMIVEAIRMDTSIWSPEIMQMVKDFLSNLIFWSILLWMCSVIGVSLFYSEMSDNLGHGVLNNLLAGKYNSPKEEERIFMFLDMKGSTTIAEKLGHVRYFELLKEYYADLSTPIIDYSGEVYQYIGDEIVISWKMKNGLSNNNCLKCFFAMKETLENQKKKYQDRFDIVPTFKAGFHYGKVTTGEIGVIKKDIIFTGDVLNTTARIQSLCNTYKTDLIISEQLINQLNSTTRFEPKLLGEAELRGRNEKINLFTLN